MISEKAIGVDESIIDEIFKDFMEMNMPPDIIKNMNPQHEYIFKGIFMAGAQAFSAITDSMEQAKVPDHVGAKAYAIMVESAEKQMLGKPFDISMTAMQMPSPNEVH